MAEKEKNSTNKNEKYRFAISKDETFEEVWFVRLSKYNAILIIIFLFVFLVGGTASLIAFTNLREFIPGYPDIAMRRDLLMNAIRLDSLESEIVLRDRYFANMNAIISGKGPIDTFSMQASTSTYSTINFDLSPEDSVFRASVENDNRFALSLGQHIPETTPSLSNLHFFVPVKGLVSSSFSPMQKHYGTDIVTEPKATVAAVLDGTVIFTGWTMETGYVIELQHSNNIVSVYKHNNVLLKEVGDEVRAGELISIVGDSGELYTSGPHLHFELWYKGEPLDPERHILF